MREKSKRIYESCCEVIPAGVNSPVRAFRTLDLSPLIIERGVGDELIDVDGNSYIDFCMSWGALILGHAHPNVVQAVQAQVLLGAHFGTTTPSEEKLAHIITEEKPWIEKIRFVSSGTEATMTAVRLARAATGKKKIVKFIGNYHGHHDQFLMQAGSGLSTIPSSKGVLQEMIQHTISLPYNNTSNFYQTIEQEPDIAAVIFEPTCGNMGVVPIDSAFLSALQQETKKIGALLIADECITGFRLPNSIEADITCLGKIIGGGFPIGALGGKSRYMDQLAPLGEVYQAGTFAGHPISMVAGLATLDHVKKAHFYKILQEKTDRLIKPIQAEIQKRNLVCSLNQVGSMFTIFFGPCSVSNQSDLDHLDLNRFRSFFRFLFERNIYIPPSQYEAWFVSSAHTEEHIDYTRETILEFLQKN